jgi:hypothetical protein
MFIKLFDGFSRIGFYYFSTYKLIDYFKSNIKFFAAGVVGGVFCFKNGSRSGSFFTSSTYGISYTFFKLRIEPFSLAYIAFFISLASNLLLSSDSDLILEVGSVTLAFDRDRAPKSNFYFKDLFTLGLGLIFL